MFRVIYLFYILHYLKNWRPISLLNCDYEIAAKVIASRIKTVLPTIINFDQTGFLKGRSIGENVRLIDSIINFTKLKDIPDLLLFVDCVVPENIHTPPTEDHGNSEG